MSPPEHPADWSRATRPCGDSIILVAAAPRRCASLLQFVCGLDDSPRGLSSRRGRSWGRAAPCRCAPMPSSGRRTAVVVLVLGVAAQRGARAAGAPPTHTSNDVSFVRSAAAAWEACARDMCAAPPRRRSSLFPAACCCLLSPCRGAAVATTTTATPPRARASAHQRHQRAAAAASQA